MTATSNWISDTESLERFVARVSPGPLAVDTEADSFHHYREKICLLQLTFDGEDLLVDTLSAVDTGVLRPLFVDRSVRKILHGADYDLRLLDRDLDLQVQGLFDTMIAARLSGARSFGLAALLEGQLGVTVDKRFQRADWSIRPLPLDMQDYAASDTRHLAQLAALLEDRLAELGRAEWAAEECARLEKIRWTAGTPAAERYLSVKGSGKLDRRGLAILRELCALRDERARARDVPVFRILRDDCLLRMASSAVRLGSSTGLDSEIPSSWRKGSRRQELQDALDRGLALPDDALPRRPERERRKKVDPAFERRSKGLRADRERLATELDLEPSVLAPRALLEGGLQTMDRGGDPAELPEMRRWQSALLAPLFDRWQA